MPPTLLPEIYHQVALKLQQDEQLATLASLAGTSKSMNDLVSSVLYKRLRITKHNAAAIFWGILPHVDESEAPSPKKNTEIKDTVRKEWSLWPDIALGEDEDEDEDDGSISSVRDSEMIPVHPDGNTNHRKLHNLSQVTEIIFESLPSLSTSEHLMNFYHHISKSTISGKLHRVFHHIKSIQFTSNFVYELSNWLNLNLVIPRKENIKKHLFIDFLLLSISIRNSKSINFIIDFPIFTNSMKQHFMKRRYGSQEVVRRCGVEATRNRRMEMEWNNFKIHCLSYSLIPLIWNWNIKHLLIRNLREEYLPPIRAEAVGIEFRSRSPNKERAEDSEQDEEDVEVKFEKRIVQILGALQPPIEHLRIAVQNVKTWESVGAELGQGKEVENDVRAKLKSDIGAKVLFTP